MSEEVRTMFSDISNQYDMLNDVLSLGRHRIWKKKFIKKIALPELGKHLDVATGTGDIAGLIANHYGSKTTVIGVDFSESMIINANLRRDRTLENLSFKVGDATKLEFEDNYFDSVSISFGIRNIPNLVGSIHEMSRVIKSSGTFAIMEFGTPTPPFSWFYTFYSKFIIPNIGKMLSGNDNAYTYLPKTIKKFPYGDAFKKILLDTTLFSKVEVKKYEFGTVYAYFCTKK